MITLEKLTEMTDNLPRVINFDDFVTFVEDDYIEYNVENGRCFGIVLLSRESVAVTKIFISKGSLFPLNKAGISTSVTVFRGKINIRVNGSDTILEAGGVLHIPCDKEFGAVAIEDTWIIHISVPRRGGYDLPEKHKRK